MGVSKAFKPIMENTLKYLNVGKSSDTSSKTDYSKVPNVQGDEVQKAEDSVNAQSLKPITIGNGKQIKQQSVKSGTKVLPHSKVMLMTDGELTMPDMTGWTKEDVLAFEDLTKIKVSTKGNGFVTNQSISKGQIIKNKDKIEVSLSAEDTDDDQEKTDEDSSDKNQRKIKLMRIIQMRLHQVRMKSRTPTRKMILMTAQMKHQVLREIINLRELDINNRLGLTF